MKVDYGFPQGLHGDPVRGGHYTPTASNNSSGSSLYYWNKTSWTDSTCVPSQRNILGRFYQYDEFPLSSD